MRHGKLLTAINICLLLLVASPSQAQAPDRSQTMRDMADRFRGGLLVAQPHAFPRETGGIPASVSNKARAFQNFLRLEPLSKPGFPHPPIARVEFRYMRMGTRACPDHYPAKWVIGPTPCPLLHSNTPPLDGWKRCPEARERRVRRNKPAFFIPSAKRCPSPVREPEVPESVMRATCPTPQSCLGGRPRLPKPNMTPSGHVPCMYDRAAFFVPEDRFCPSPSKGQEPPPGYALYVSWDTKDNTDNFFYFRRESEQNLIGMSFQRVIYGQTDDRFSLVDATHNERLAAASTGIIVKNGELTPDEDANMFQLANNPSWQQMCTEERFENLPRPGFCSGVKISDTLVATAAHCLRTQWQCNNTSVIFGYGQTRKTDNLQQISATQLYACHRIVAKQEPSGPDERAADWTIFEVDRPIQAPTASLASAQRVAPGQVTTVIGHPMGLPTIVTRLGVIQAAASEYFITNSDTFVGNSGSAVFDAASIEAGHPLVVGLLRSGDYDFVEEEGPNGTCLRARWCGNAGCTGEDVSYADGLIETLKNIEAAGPTP